MRRLRFLVIASLFVGCTLMTKYDPDGQPCDLNEPDPLLSCLSDAGYTCVSGLCKKGTAPGTDGGADAGRADSGTDAGRDGGFDGGLDSGLVDAGPTDGGKDGGNLGG